MICAEIKQLVNYATRSGLIAECDKNYAVNSILALLKLDAYEDVECEESDDLEAILASLCDFAAEKGLIDNNVTERDLFDSALMGALTPRPSEVIRKFKELYSICPREATDWYYSFSKNTDYIRTYRVKKDMKWAVPSVYGDIDITINLSKPEKDPKAIAAAKNAPQNSYPKCQLCPECEGYAGTLNYPGRSNHRIIPIKMDEKDWFFQYSPYVYYNEHCIALSAEHTPMKIDRSSFVKMLDFISIFPHYFIGSNADLPIVGGSILSHDHMQGGRYTFAMEKAPIEKAIEFAEFPDVEAGIVKWPLSVIRLTSVNRENIIDLADMILGAWRDYTDEDAFIYAYTDGVPHNTITPIARMRGGKYELDLVLRNNITTEEHPLGVYHPHAELHNIKKENIGLIEVMGLAVLPARLKKEMELLAKTVLSGNAIVAVPEIEKHAEWFDSFKDKYVFTEDNIDKILHDEIGNTFIRVLEDAGVYKCTEEGREAFVRFIESI
ncbi:MAG: UDP-glucose--hexose-1-phosphate uridylyltransferase [Clostridia bacterium]|nr:UDP-glucose--hexose-1-phosphate uridylyltransferase [Clostridia bacterium]